MGNVRDALNKHQAESAGGNAAPPGSAASAPGTPAAAAASDAPAVEPQAAAPTAKVDTAAGPPRPADAAPPRPGQAAASKSAATPGPAAAGTNTYSPVLSPHVDRGGDLTEQYRALRTSLLGQFVEERFAMMITSAEQSEGKSVTCMNLALVLAEREESRTIVLDCDLRGGQVARLLHADNSNGLADVLAGRAALRDVVRPTVYHNLFYVACGRVPHDQVSALLGRTEFQELLAQLRRQYDFVLLDTPPVNRFADAGLIGRTVGEALVVVRMYRTRRESVDRAIRLLRAANVKIDGIVLTHQKYYIPKYLYRYS